MAYLLFECVQLVCGTESDHNKIAQLRFKWSSATRESGTCSTKSPIVCNSIALCASVHVYRHHFAEYLTPTCPAGCFNSCATESHASARATHNSDKLGGLKPGIHWLYHFKFTKMRACKGRTRDCGLNWRTSGCGKLCSLLTHIIGQLIVSVITPWLVA